MSHPDDDAEIIAAAREGFLEEASDMLRQFEQALLIMETDPADRENLNAAFRAAHTIKGTAGMFGFSAVVAFTHNVESVMDALREGQIGTTDALSALLLESRDQMGRLLDEVVSGEQDPAVAADSERLGRALVALLNGGAAAQAPAAAPRAGPEDLLPEDDGGAVCDPTPADSDIAPDIWHLCLRFRTDALRNGLDPLAFIRYLGHLGTVQAIHTWADRVPELAQLDAESCHLGFDLRLKTEATREQIAAVFEFAEDDCDIHILPPSARGGAYAGLLAALDDNPEQQEAHRLVLLAQGCPLVDAAPPPATRQAAEPAAGAHALSAAAQAEPAEPARPVAGAAPANAEPADAVPLERRQEGPDRRAEGGRRGNDARFIRVRADKLDQLIDLIGELVIASSGAQLAAQVERAPRVLEATQRIHDLVQEARDGALGLRMVPIGETFSRFNRVVRDISRQLNKQVDLQITGADTELDKSMVEVIADPLMHLVRNSLDHGIETPDDRVLAGKPPTGRLALHAYHESGSIVIEVSDDGKGLDRHRIQKKAIERGLIGSEQVLSDSEVHQLICHPGFSTAEAVSNLSGRGVGMDVVKRNVEALRGQMMLASEMGRGTTTQIRVPLTLAIIDGFLCEVGGVHYVVPLELVVECIETPREYRLEPGRISGYFDLRHEMLPYLDVARYFGRSVPEGTRRSMLVVRSGASKVGLIVDRLEGEHQTVIKPLGPLFQQLPGIAGSTILGSGEVALIFDVPALVEQCIRSGQAARTAGAHAPHTTTLSPPLARDALPSLTRD